MDKYSASRWTTHPDLAYCEHVVVETDDDGTVRCLSCRQVLIYGPPLYRTLTSDGCPPEPDEPDNEVRA